LWINCTHNYNWEWKQKEKRKYEIQNSKLAWIILSNKRNQHWTFYVNMLTRIFLSLHYWKWILFFSFLIQSYVCFFFELIAPKASDFLYLIWFLRLTRLKSLRNPISKLWAFWSLFYN
jgi:hypothetical protein